MTRHATDPIHAARLMATGGTDAPVWTYPNGVITDVPTEHIWQRYWLEDMALADHARKRGDLEAYHSHLQHAGAWRRSILEHIRRYGGRAVLR